MLDVCDDEDTNVITIIAPSCPTIHASAASSVLQLLHHQHYYYHDEFRACVFAQVAWSLAVRLVVFGNYVFCCVASAVVPCHQRQHHHHHDPDRCSLRSLLRCRREGLLSARGRAWSGAYPQAMPGQTQVTVFFEMRPPDPWIMPVFSLQG